MQQVTRVVLAIDAPEVVDEVLRLLDRSGVANVVGTADDAAQLDDAIRQLEPDLVIAEPRFTASAAGGAPCIAIASRESVLALRTAIDAGARAFYVWPTERDALLDRVEAFGSASRSFERRATVIAVHASRGGAGATFVASHLAQAFAEVGHATAVIDVDPFGGDLATALGIPDDAEGVHRVPDVVAVVDELLPAAFLDTIWRHPGGFGVVGAASPDAEHPDPASVGRVVDLAAASTDVVVLHTASSIDAVTLRCLQLADVVCEVVSLDVMAFRSAVRTMARFAEHDLEQRTRFVVNRATRSEVVPSDVDRVFGCPPAAVIPFDGSVPRLQDHGRLLPSRARSARTIARLARALLAEPGSSRGAA